jgi:hypothetical protein
VTSQDAGALTARIHRENRQELRVALLHVVLMTALAAAGNWVLMRVAVSIIGVIRLLAACVIWRHDVNIRALEALPEPTRQVRLVQVQLGFVKSVKYWYSWPLTLALAPVGFAFWNASRSILGVLLCTAAAIALLLGTHQMNDVRWVGELESARRSLPSE